MELLGIILALAGSLVAYLVEQKWWITFLETVDEKAFASCCLYLDREGIPYRTKTCTSLEGEQIQTVYKVKVLVRELERIKAP